MGRFHPEKSVKYCVIHLFLIQEDSDVFNKDVSLINFEIQYLLIHDCPGVRWLRRTKIQTKLPWNEIDQQISETIITPQSFNWSVLTTI
jgi:hypothetical protein